MTKFIPSLLCIVLVTACGPSNREQKLADEVLELKTSDIQKEADQKITKVQQEAGQKLAEVGQKLAKQNETHQKENAARLHFHSSELKEINTTVEQLRAVLEQALKQRNEERTKRVAALAMIEKERQVAKAAYDEAFKVAQAAQQMANKVPALEAQLAAYENLGAPRDIMIRLDRLVKLEAAAATNLPPMRGEVGTIQTYDPTLDFYVINVGSAKGIKKGDTFTIFRAGRAIGKIGIDRTQPTISIGKYLKGFPKPPSPFKKGDRVMRIK